MSFRSPLLLLPGLLCDARLWRHQTDSLADMLEVRVAEIGEEPLLGAIAARILAEAPDSFALAGLSMGGYVAFEIFRQAPDRVERLALLDTSPYADSQEQISEREALIDLARRGEFKGVTRRLLPLLVHPDRVAETALAETIFAMAERVGREAFIAQQRAIMTRPDSRHDLGLIHVPTLVLCGRQDALTPLAVSAEMVEKIPGAHLVIIEDCGHLSPLERPWAVSAVLRYWLQL